jgi:ABC-type lipoprotein release transport system permease subunit
MLITEPIILAIIGFLGSGVGSILGILASNKLTVYRIEQLEEKVNKHNNLIERTYQLEKQESILEEKIAVLSDQLEKLEGEM